MPAYNLTRRIDELLEAHQSDPASFTVKLYPEFWTLNNGTKSLYNSQMASLLDDIRAQRIPVDFLEIFDNAKLPFYDGCMIVELHDFRPLKATDQPLEEPLKSRVVLSPSPETLWADICLMNEKGGKVWTDQEALEVEARILVATTPPLCLDPNPFLSRMANNIMRASVPTTPLPLKRKAAIMEQEDEDVEKARRAKLTQFMNPKYMKPAVTPSFPILETIKRMRENRTVTPAPANTVSASTQSAVPLPGAAQPLTRAPMHYPPAAPVQPAVPIVQMAYPQPASIPHPQPNGTPAPQPSSTPVPSVSGSSNGHDPKKKPKTSEAVQSPRAGATSLTPVPTAPNVLPPIPPHVQYAANANQQSPRTSQSPHPAPSSHTASSPSNATTRPPSVRPQSVQPPQPSTATQPAAVTTTLPAGYAQFPKSKVPHGAMPTNGASPVSFPQGVQAGAHGQPQPVPFMFYQLAAQQQQQNAAAQQRMNQVPGRNPTPAARSPMVAAAQAAQRGSPLAPTQRLASRSPMPPAQQPQQQQSQQQTPIPQQANYNYAALQSQYGAMAQQFRPVAHGHAPHPQIIHPLANGAAQANGSAQQGQMISQEQAQAAQMAAAYPQMYYAQMQHGRMPGYWPVGMGRGAPVVNGQHQIPGMAAHMQQMQVQNKPVQGGVQGS